MHVNKIKSNIQIAAGGRRAEPAEIIREYMVVESSVVLLRWRTV
jgi:hypothetical protein